MIKIKKGLDIPISGSSEHKITDFKTPRSVALAGSDFHGLKPGKFVNDGDHVIIGLTICEDKKKPGVILT